MDYPIAPVAFTRVTFDDCFWLPRLTTNREVTIPYDFRKCEETGRIDNFAKAAGLMEGAHEGIFFNDSDVFKVVEGAACSLSLRTDPELDAYLDDLITKIAGAQEEDGYLYTARTIDPTRMDPEREGPTRWSNLLVSHELYNVGHLYEAAAAHHQATGKRSLLEVAIRNAELIDSVFGPGRIRDVPGHEEIEIGLVKLYRATGERRYLDLAKFFLDQRGQPDRGTLQSNYDDPGYTQDHLPVTEQREAVGHAVRAGYLYSGMADVAALTGDRAYIDALDALWTSVVARRMYLTGGIGSRHHGEAFGEDYELPNTEAYAETCAALANVLWNHRMFLLHGDAKYLDVLERTLYNGFLSGISLSGDTFFYAKPARLGRRVAVQRAHRRRALPLVRVLVLPYQRGAVAAVAAGLRLRSPGRRPVRQPLRRRHRQRPKRRGRRDPHPGDRLSLVGGRQAHHRPARASRVRAAPPHPGLGPGRARPQRPLPLPWRLR